MEKVTLKCDVMYKDKKYLIGSKRISKGAQKKYFRDGYYYKVNNNGRKHEIDVLNIQLRAYEDLFRLR